MALRGLSAGLAGEDVGEWSQPWWLRRNLDRGAAAVLFSGGSEGWAEAEADVLVDAELHLHALVGL
jgi:hypothetical protein